VGIKLKRKKEDAGARFERGSAAYHDADTVDHVMSEIKNGDAKKEHSLDNVLTLSNRSVSMGKPVEAYQLLQAYLEENEGHERLHEVSYQIALVALRHLHKPDLAKDWLGDVLSRDLSTEFREKVQSLFDKLN
jgi:hypothetical protein